MRTHRSFDSGQHGRIFAGLGLIFSALGAVLLVLAVIGSDGTLTKVAVVEAAPVSITLTSVTDAGGGNWYASGTWSISGGQCWTPGSRFHGYIIVWDNGASSTPVVPTVTYNDTGDGKKGPEDSLSGAGIKQYILPAPCNGGVWQDSVQGQPDPTDRDATNQAWPAPGQPRIPATFAITGAGDHFICAAVLHTQTSGADADATDCSNQPIVVETPTPTATATNTATATATATNTATATATATNTATATATNTATATATGTNTPQPTNTPTNTSVPTSTNTAVPTSTNTAVPTSTSTSVPTSTATTAPTSTSVPPTATVAVTVFIEFPTVVPTATPTPTLVAQVLPTVAIPTPVAQVLVKAGSGGAGSAVNSGLLGLGIVIILMGGGLLVLSRSSSS